MADKHLQTKKLSDSNRVLSYLAVFIFFIIFLTVTFKLEPVESSSYDPSDTRIIGYEFLDTSGNVVAYSIASTVHIWNQKDDYFFDKTSGMQFSNHFNDYWTKNVFCAGYKPTLGDWVYDCTDELPFIWNIQTDNSTYVNITGYRDKDVLGKTVRLGIRYHLNTSDSKLPITVSAENIGSSAITNDIGFAWRTKDIRIRGDYENDQILINGSTYRLNNSLNLSFTSLSYPEYELFDRNSQDKQYLTLNWDNSLNYILTVKTTDGYYNGSLVQYNAPVTLAINAGPLAIGQQKHTTFYWKDPATDVFFDSFEDGLSWTNWYEAAGSTGWDNVAQCPSSCAGGTRCACANNTATNELMIKYNYSLTDYSDCMFYYYTLVDSSFDVNEYYYVDVRDSDGSWVNIYSCTQGQACEDTAWTAQSYNITAGVGLHSIFSVRVRAVNNDATEEAGFDVANITCKRAAYPSFSGYWDDNFTVTGGGYGHFNVTVENTNGTVVLEIGGVSVPASNTTATAFNISYNFTDDGVYTYRWGGWSSDVYNSSGYMYYTVNRSYGSLNVNISYPSNVTHINYTMLFSANASITCLGGSYAKCGTVSALLRYNLSSTSPDYVVNLTYGGLPFYITGNQTWWNASYSKKKKITITGGEEVLTNFTVFVRLDKESSMSATYSDVRFVNSSESGELFYELDSYNTTSVGAWVMMPTLNTGANIIYAYYGNSTVGGSQNKNSTWDNYYSAVYHFSEGTGAISADSKGADNNLTFRALWNSTPLSPFGVAAQFDPPKLHNVSTPDASNLDFAPQVNFTVEAWADYYLDNISTIITIVQKNDWSFGNAWHLKYAATNTYGMKLGGTSESGAVETSYAAYPARHNLNRFYVLKRDGNYAYSYVDSVLAGTHSGVGVADAGDVYSMSIGSRVKNLGDEDMAWVWNGTIDEVRISRVARSSAWINRSYQNANTSNFVAGPESSMSDSINLLSYDTILSGRQLNVSWMLNTTAHGPESYYLDVLFNSTFGNTLVPDNDTEDRLVVINISGLVGEIYSTNVSEGFGVDSAEGNTGSYIKNPSQGSGFTSAIPRLVNLFKRINQDFILGAISWFFGLFSRNPIDTISMGSYQVPTDGLILWLKMDENSSTLLDSSGHGHSGTVYCYNAGASSVSPAYIEGGYNFNGYSYCNTSASSSGIYVPNIYVATDTELNNVWNLSSNFTISIWMKAGIGGSVTSAPFGKEGSLYPWTFRYSSSDKKISAVVYNGSTGGGNPSMYSNALTEETWNLVTLTYDADKLNVSIYINGARYNSTYFNPYIPVGNTATPRIGSRGNPGFRREFNGTVDEAMVYNKTLSDAEVQQIYLATSNEKEFIVTTDVDRNRYSIQPLIIEPIVTRLAVLKRTVIQEMILDAVNNFFGFFMRNFYQGIEKWFAINAQLNTIRSLAQQATFESVINRIYLPIRTIPQMLSLEFVINRLSSLNYKVSQMITLDILTSRAFTLTQTIITSFGLDSAVFKLSLFMKSIPQAIQLNVVVSRVVYLTTAVAQSLKLEDVISRISLIMTLLLSPLAIFSAVNPDMSAFRSQHEGMQINSATDTTQYLTKYQNQPIDFDLITITMSNIIRGTSQEFTFWDVVNATVYESMQEYFKDAYEAVNFNAMATRIYMPLRNPAQLISFDSVVNRLTSIFKVIGESIKINAILARLFFGSQSSTQNIDVLGTTDTTQSLSKSQSQAINLDLSTKYLLRLFRTANTKLTFEDYLNLNGIKIRKVDLDLTLADNVYRKFIAERETNQKLTLVDYLTKNGYLFRSSTQAMLFNDAMYRKYLTSRGISEDMMFDMALYEQYLIWRGTSNEINFNDELYRKYLGEMGIGQGIILDTSTVRIVYLLKGASQEITFFSMASRTVLDIGNIFSGSVAQSISLDSIASRMYAPLRLAPQLVSIDLVVNRLAYMTYSVQQNININTITNRISFSFRVVSDSFSILLDISRTLLGRTVTTQEISVDSSADPTQFLFKAPNQLIGVDFSTLTISNILRGTNTMLTFSDYLSSRGIRIRKVDLDLTLADNVYRKFIAERETDQKLTLVDYLTKNGYSFRSSTQAMLFNDAMYRKYLTSRGISEDMMFDMALYEQYLIWRGTSNEINFNDELYRKYLGEMGIGQGIIWDVYISRILGASRHVLDYFTLNLVVFREVFTDIPVVREIAQAISINSVTNRLAVMTHTITQEINFNLITIRIKTMTTSVFQAFSFDSVVDRLKTLASGGIPSAGGGGGGDIPEEDEVPPTSRIKPKVVQIGAIILIFMTIFVLLLLVNRKRLKKYTAEIEGIASYKRD
jgi:hypothetical protein